MARARRIAILIHEADPFPRTVVHLIWPVVRAWRRAGFQTQVVKGAARKTGEADLLVAHVDMTRTPEEYVQYMRRFPIVLNRAVTDISKRSFSRNLLARRDDYSGRVIVKTNENFGGAPERRHAAPGRDPRRWATVRFLRSYDYRVFSHLSAVPEGVWSNPSLVVEKFIPEREGDYYAIRVCIFLGDVLLNRRIFSRQPIVKGANITHSEPAEVPEDLHSVRRQLGFDYGKFDYVMHEGKLHLLDANRTPGMLADAAANAQIADKLAPGIDRYFGGDSAALRG